MDQIIRRMIGCLLVIGLWLLTLFVWRKHRAVLCKDIEMQIKDHSGQSFITETDILDLLQSMHTMPLIGTPLKAIDSYHIRKQLENKSLVKSVLICKSWTGTLKIYLTTKYVIARMIHPTGPNGTQMYVDENGDLISIVGLPLLRLLVIGGDHIATTEDKLQIRDKGLLELLHYLYNDPFFRHQITSLQVGNNHKMILGTQVGDHQIEFGKAENIYAKFEKLRLFYSQVIPYKGWHAYHRVNLEFDHQLICE